MALFDFSDFYKKDDEDETPSQKARDQVNTQIEKKKTEGSLFDFSDFEQVRTRRQDPQPQTVETPVSEPKKNIFQKTGDFVKNTFTRENISQVGSAIKQTVSNAGNAIKNELNRENEEAKKYMGSDNQFSMEEINDYSTIPFLQKEKIDMEIRIRELEQKPNRGKIDNYRLKNMSDRYKEVDRLLNGTSEDRMKANTFITGLSLERFTANVAGDFLSSASFVTDVIGWKADTADKEGIAQGAMKVSDKLDAWGNEIRPRNPELGDAVAGGFGSALLFFVPGVGVAKGSEMLAKVSPKLALLFGQSASSTLESSAEAGDVYWTLRKEGKSKEEANAAANNTFWANVGLNVVLDRFGILSEGKRLRVLKTTTAEGVQEMSQQVISNVNTGRPYDEGLLESGLVGAVTGGVIGGVYNPDTNTGAPQLQTTPEVQVVDSILKKKLTEEGGSTREEDKKPLPETIQNELNQAPELSTLAQEASQYQSADDFAQIQGTGVGTQIGVLPASQITARDAVDTTTKEYQDLKADIQKNGIKEPLSVTVDEQGKITTFEGSHRVTIGQELGINVPVLVTQGKVDGLQTIQQFYESAKQNRAEVDQETKQANRTFNEENTRRVVEQTVAGERESFRLDNEANIKKYSSGFGDAKPTDTIMVYRAGTDNIKYGDYVTTSEERAKTVYLKQREGAELLALEVPISDLVHGNGLKTEFVYSPKSEQTVQEKATTPEKKTAEKTTKSVQETPKQKAQREQGLELNTEADVKKAVLDRARAYAERNDTFEAFADDINTLGSTIGNLEGGVTFDKKTAKVTLDNGKTYTYKLADIFEEAKQPYEYASTQLNLPSALASQIKAFARKIPDSQLSINEADGGRESQPHVTVLFGLTEEAESNVKEIVEQTDPVEVTLGKTSLFENEEYDVLKIDVASPALMELNKKLDVLDTPGKTFDSYIPHVTIAYLQKGQGAQYAGDTTFEGKKFTMTELAFSKPNGEQVVFELKGTKPAKDDVFSRSERTKAQQEVKEVLLSGESEAENAQNVKAFFDKNVNVPTTRAEAGRLKAIRAEARRTMFEAVGANTGNWKRDFAFFQTLRQNPQMEQFIDAVEEGITKIDEALEQSGYKPTTAPTGYADVGGYADVQSTEKRLGAIKSIELPELVRIAREITGMTPGVGKLRGGRGTTVLGRFYSQANGYIALSPEVFRDPVLTAKVMAHEMGHMTDFFEDKTMARGNLIGRVASLKNFMRTTFTNFETEVKISELLTESRQLTDDRRATEAGSKENKALLAKIKKVNAQIKELRKKSTLKQETLYEELKALSRKWKPFDEEAVPASFTKYRYSAPELYADAVSVLFNDPDLLKAEAPTFWKAFFENLNRKPTVASNFYAIWDLLNQGQREVLDQRAKDVREMFDKGEDKVLAMMKEKQNREENYAFKLKYELIDKNQALIDKVNELKRKGTPVSDEANPVYWLEEHNYVGGLVKNWVEENIDPIYKELRENDLTWEDLGEVLFHERVVNERGAVKNVIGFIRENAIEQYNSIKDELPKNIEEMDTTKQIEILKQKFGDLKDESGQSLYDQLISILPQGIANPLGFDADTSKKQLEFLKESLGDRWAVVEKVLPKYRAAVQKVLAEAEKEGFYKPDLIKQMKANPAYATFQVLEYMDLNIPASIKQQVGTLKEIANPATSTVIKTISTIKAIERNKVKKKIVEFLKENYSNEIMDARTIFNGKAQVPIEPKDVDLALFTTIENGKLVGYYVDPYIASTMEFSGTAHANAVLSTLHFFNSKLFRPLFITFNLGFQSFNAVRDFTRFYKNVPGITPWGALQRYAQALPAAKARAFDLPDATIAEMEKSKILGITYNDVVSGYTEADKQIDAVIARAGVSPLKTTKRNVFVRPAEIVLDFIEKTGNMIETIPKVAGYRELNGKLPPKELGNYIRTKVGSPDFLRKGAGYRWYNEVFLFSNAIKEGIRSDFQVATDPKTRGGYWFKTAQVTLLPKLIMFAALAGMFGEGLKKLFQNVSDYDLTNYVVIPMGEDQNGKTIYLRVPQDETGRLIGGLLWKALRIATNKEIKFEDVSDVMSYTGGQVPSLSPVFQSIFAISQFVAGQNPYDFFRGREVIPDAEFQAGGKYALKPYLVWQINQLGGGVFLKSYYSTQPAETKGWVQKVVEAPVISNILGRWLKVSDYGQTEANQKIIKEVETQSARERLETNNKINKAIEQYRSGELTEARKRDLLKDLIRDTVGEPPYRDDRRTQVTNIEKKFRLGIIKGESDESINALIYTNTNDEKRALLEKMEKEMSESEYRQFIGKLIDEKIISSTLAKELRK